MVLKLADLAKNKKLIFLFFIGVPLQLGPGWKDIRPRFHTQLLQRQCIRDQSSIATVVCVALTLILPFGSLIKAFGSLIDFPTEAFLFIVAEVILRVREALFDWQLLLRFESGF